MGIQHSLSEYCIPIHYSLVNTVRLFTSEYGTGIQYSLVNNVRGYIKLGILDSLRHRSDYKKARREPGI